MIGRRCNAGNGISRPVLIARNLSVKKDSLRQSVSQEKYCGGFSSVDPPLSIPNREVKRTYADGTARPGGRVGSRRFSKARSRERPGLFVSCGSRKTAFVGALPPEPPRLPTYRHRPSGSVPVSAVHAEACDRFALRPFSVTLCYTGYCFETIGKKRR